MFARFASFPCASRAQVPTCLPHLTSPQRSKDDPQFFTASLWLMESGALQVRVLVDGAKGQGSSPFRCPSSAQRTLPMQKPLAGLLLALMLFLAVGVVCIVGAIVREGNLEAGEIPDRSHKRRACVVMLATAIVVGAILYLRQGLVGCRRDGVSTPGGFLQASSRRARAR